MLLEVVVELLGVYGCLLSLVHGELVSHWWVKVSLWVWVWVDACMLDYNFSDNLLVLNLQTVA